jgi:hypothetical protein
VIQREDGDEGFQDVDEVFRDFILQDLDRILNADEREIGRNVEDDDIQAFLKNDALKAHLRTRHGAGGLTAIIGKLFIGQLAHKNPHITEDSEKNFFQSWLIRDQESIPDQEDVNLDEQTMNCWESVLYTAIQAGVVPKADIATMYATAKQQGNPAQLMTSVYAYLRSGQGASRSIDVSHQLLQIPEFVEMRDDVLDSEGGYHKMNWSSSKRERIREKAKTLVEQGHPGAGQLVIYERTAGSVGPTHVALCLGGTRIMTLNGEGHAVEEHQIGDWKGVFPKDEEDRLTLDLLVNGWHVYIIDPPWLTG